MEACRRGEITRDKLRELAEDAGADRVELEVALLDEGMEPQPVDVILPE